MQDVPLETIIDYTLDFIWIVGLPNVYEDYLAELTIADYRALLPDNLISINQVMDKKTGVSLRTSTGTFMTYDHDTQKSYMYDNVYGSVEPTFKLQGNIIYTTFETGEIAISYKGIPVDEDGFPMIPDHNVFLKTLELYVKKEWFTIQFDLGRITIQSLNNTQQQYAWSVGQCQNQFIMPSISEMELFLSIFS